METIRKMAHPLQMIGKMYDYALEASSEEAINLGIDWSSVDTEALFGDDSKDFDTIDDSRPGTTKSPYVTTIPLHKTEIPSRQGQLQLIGAKRLDIYQGNTKFILGLINHDFPVDGDQKQQVGGFQFIQTKQRGREEWEMKHRYVSESYRSQGIAPNMLHFGEAFLKKRAQETQIPQVMTAEVGQVDVLLWLLKEGFVPENGKDAGRINRILSGDPSLKIVSGPPGKDDGQTRDWYIFEKERLNSLTEVQRSVMWKGNDKKNPHNYTNCSFRIKLKKPIE